MIALDKLSKDTMMGYPDTTININQDGYVYASELVKAYKRNDSCAIAIIDKFVEDLSSVVMDFCNIFRPNKIVIGGGICHAPEIIDMVAKTCRRESYGYKNSPAVEIVCAKLGSNAGMLGASVCFEESDVQLENLNDLLKSDNKSEDLEENEFKGKSLLDAVIRSSEESLNNSDEAQEDSGFDNVQDDYEYHETTGGSLETQKMAEEEQTHEEVIEEELQEPEQEEEIIYDEGIIERVNALLQKKKY